MIILQNSFDANVIVTSHNLRGYNISGLLDLTDGGKLNIGASKLSYSAARLLLEKIDNDSIAAGRGAIRVFDMSESLYK